eukprot:TRINITY_DN4358_c0_g1_i16.p1 TRINITY_DN4358_c0_g1~~TRINITY_DN4358_c0_g1_i16.p1  ORF type:complete len:227 (-),score=26.37 TRINITY_DN4358_c0_g1_i16:569-1249(-)
MVRIPYKNARSFVGSKEFQGYLPSTNDKEEKCGGLILRNGYKTTRSVQLFSDNRKNIKRLSISLCSNEDLRNIKVDAELSNLKSQHCNKGNSKNAKVTKDDKEESKGVAKFEAGQIKGKEAPNPIAITEQFEIKKQKVPKDNQQLQAQSKASTTDKRFGYHNERIVLYLTRRKIQAETNVFIFTTSDDYMRRAFVRRGWIENPAANSAVFDFRWDLNANAVRGLYP